MDTMPAPASDALTGAFVRNAWYMAMWAEDLPPGQPVGRTILGEPVVLFRRADGSPAAITDRCAHRFAPRIASGLTRLHALQRGPLNVHILDQAQMRFAHARHDA